MIQTAKHLLINLPGWRTKRKIVVIESDDWGSIRVSSKAALDEFKSKGIPLDSLSYNRIDALESEKDIARLFETLTEFKDIEGNHPIITNNTIVSNPDFDKILASDFQQYHYELFTDTLQKYPEHRYSFTLIQNGIEAGVFRPQFHGREHINVARWMRALRSGNAATRLAFKHRMYDLSTSVTIGEHSFMDALNYELEEELEMQKAALTEGLRHFENIFGYKSLTFIAPCYIWDDQLNETLWQAGVRGFQGGWWQFQPVQGQAQRFNKRFHFTGQRNALGQVYLVRNAHFEPAENQQFDWIGDVLKRAEIAFKLRKPLIISSHRLNYIGFVDPNNREQNLKRLKKLLATLIKRWPDIEFMSSDKLTSLIINKS